MNKALATKTFGKREVSGDTEDHGAETESNTENKAKFSKRKGISGWLTEEQQKVEVGRLSLCEVTGCQHLNQ